MGGFLAYLALPYSDKNKLRPLLVLKKRKNMVEWGSGTISVII